MTLKSLKRIKHLLEEADVDFLLVTEGENFLYPHLLVYVGEDYRKRKRLIEITSQEHSLKEMTPSSYIQVQFQLTFPFTMTNATAQEVGSLLLFLNQTIELPGFELHEIDNQASYRYVLLTTPEGLNQLVISSIIGIMMLYLDQFTETIERLAEGKNTFNDLLEETTKILAQMTTPQPND